MLVPLIFIGTFYNIKFFLKTSSDKGHCRNNSATDVKESEREKERDRERERGRERERCEKEREKCEKEREKWEKRE